MEYLSQECYDRLTQDLNELVSVELPKARNELEEARAKGDLSENFEYHAAKRAHGRLLSRISYMQKTLRFARVMDTSRLDNDTVGLLRRVEITNLATNTTMAITQLYISGVISLGAMMSGLLVGAGVGLLVLFRVNPDKKENLKIVGILYVIGVLTGIVINWL